MSLGVAGTVQRVVCGTGVSGREFRLPPFRKERGKDGAPGSRLGGRLGCARKILCGLASAQDDGWGCCFCLPGESVRKGWGTAAFVVLLVRSIRLSLEVCGEAEGEASWGADGVAGEQASEVDHVENVGEVLSVDLKQHVYAIGLVNVRAGGGTDLKARIDAAAGKVDAVQDLLAVFGEDRSRVAVEFEGKAGVVLNSACDPKARFHLIADTSANGVALIL
jgi:hypothetical protein